MRKDLAAMYALTGRTAVVTGAARGIGKAVADLLASAGANVLVADILAENAAEAAAEIRRDGGQAFAFGVDISEESEVKRMYEVAQGHFKSVDILVHCAAMFPKFPLLDITVEQWDRIQAVNLRGTLAESYFRGFKRAENRGTYSTPLADAAGIEILRGPPSPIYGAVTLKGAVCEKLLPLTVATA